MLFVACDWQLFSCGVVLIVVCWLCVTFCCCLMCGVRCVPRSWGCVLLAACCVCWVCVGGSLSVAGCVLVMCVV